MSQKSNVFIYISKLCSSKRESLEDSCIQKKDGNIHITYCQGDSLEKFENDINAIVGNTSFFYFFRKKFLALLISFISVFVILTAFLSVSIYEDFLKKVVFEMPFSWEINDFISLGFVIVFFLGLLLMPSILEAEGSEFKNILSSWINKDARRLKKLKLAFSNFPSNNSIHLYNFDLEDSTHWIWTLMAQTLLNRFEEVNFYIRNDKIQNVTNRLKEFDILDIEIVKEENLSKNCDVEILLSQREQKLYSLMQLCSTVVVKDRDRKSFISLELFEYCGKNFVKEEQDSKNQLIFGFQNFINRSFDDFGFVAQEKSLQLYFTSNVTFKDLEEEQKRLAYYLRNHIEEIVASFENPITFLILYYYIKDIVLDKRRAIKVLEKFISCVEAKQQYELINYYWFDIAGEMFDFEDINSFEANSNSYYRKLSIESLNKLAFLFERNGYFQQAIFLNKYLYTINPNKYILNISSLYERMGEFQKAFDSLPKELNLGKNQKPNDVEIRYYQRKSAWIIISQRNKELKDEALGYISKLEELLFGHNEDNNPIWLWHFYNIKANLCEWEEDYKEAINYYKKCLAIPALGAFEYGATFVNMAISYRFIYINQEAKKEETINKAIKFGRIGTNLKYSVGDRDEMPVVLHNLALNILYKIVFNGFDKKLVEEVMSLSDEALQILDKTKSIKRLGMVLIESYISKSLLNLETKEIYDRLKIHLPQLGENELNQLLNIYKEFRKTNKINIIDFLEEL